MDRRSMAFCFVAAWLAVSCGGAQASSETSAAHEPSCRDTTPGGEAECTARGCTWGRPMRCSGAPPGPDERPFGPETPCTCLCAEDIERCVSAP